MSNVLNTSESENISTHFGIAVVMAMAMALGPLAIDTYLPAFPAISKSLQVSIHEISLSISLYVFVLALGQLVGGPMSDRFGRARVMLSGLGIFALASVMLSRVNSSEQLMFLRAVQGFGGGCIAVCVPAIVRDRMSGTEAARFFSLIGLIMILAPAIAPGLGSMILARFGWPAIFSMLFLYSLVLSVLLKWVVFSGNPGQPQNRTSSSVFARYRVVLSTRPALRFMFLQALSFSVMLLFISHSSYIYQQHFGASPALFSILFGANIVVMMAANLTSRHLLKRISSKRILRWSVTMQAAGIVLLLVVVALFPMLWLFLPAMMITVGAMGAITPNTQACFMEYFSEHGGTASALLGAMQFSLAGLIAVGSTWLPQTLAAVVLAQAACSIICVFLVWVYPDTEV